MAKQSRFASLKKHNREELEKAIKEGRADERSKSLCTYLNSLENFFTSSSCSGRIVLLSVKNIGEKQPKAFHRKWHRRVKLKEVIAAIEEETGKKELWLKLDPFILHIGARDLLNARKVLRCMQKAGIKRGGIILAQKEKFLIELQGTHTMALPVKSKGSMLVDRQLLRFLVKKANKKLGENYRRLQLFERVCRGDLP